MANLLLVIIYLSFISLGLPDAILGAAWPAIRISMGVSLDTAGYISLIITAGTIISSLSSTTVIKRFGTGLVTTISICLTAIALLGFSQAQSIAWFVLLSVPLGLGAGAVDAALNNYVANHYKAKHMSWLHSFWGIGAMLGPVILSYVLTIGYSWRGGYLTIAILQISLVFLLFISLPLWNRIKSIHNAVDDAQISSSNVEDTNIGMFKLKGVKYSLIAFLFYCGVEGGIGLWGSSYLVTLKNISIAQAAQWIGIYYAGITAGRFLTGFLSIKISGKEMIRYGQLIAFIGILFLIIPLPAYFSLLGLIITGLGLAPIFPSMLHETPARFGKNHSSRIIGLQMAFAYTGSTIIPPLMGFLAVQLHINIIIYIAIACTAGMLIASEAINSQLKLKPSASKN